MFYTYLLKCSDGSFYCGYTDNVKKRFEKHSSGNGAKYTRSRLPLELVHVEEYETKHEAMSRECAIKRMTHAEKEMLTSTKSEDIDIKA